MNPVYRRISYQKAIIERLAKFLREGFVEDDSPRFQTILADNLPFDEREVPQDEVMGMLQLLDREVRSREDKLSEFALTRRKAESFLVSEDEPVELKKKKKVEAEPPPPVVESKKEKRSDPERKRKSRGEVVPLKGGVDPRESTVEPVDDGAESTGSDG